MRRENSRVRSERFALSLDAGQVTAVVLGALVLLGGAFVLGMSAGRQAAAARAAPSATRAVLEHLDDPLTNREEPPPELKATQALTDARPIEKAAPVVAVRAAPTATAKSLREPLPPTSNPTSTSTSTPTATSTSTPTATSTSTPTAPSTPTAMAEADRRSDQSAPSVAPPETARGRGAVQHPKGGYTIQIASSTTRADAERMVRQLSGRQASIVVADVPGKGRRYRVQVGSYPSQEAAKRQLPQLSRAGLHGIVTALR